MSASGGLTLRLLKGSPVVLALFAAACSTPASPTSHQAGRVTSSTTTSSSTTTTTTNPGMPLPAGVPAQFRAPTVDTLSSVEHCPTSAMESSNFSFLCSADGTGPGLLLGYSVPGTDSIDSAQQRVSNVLSNAGWTVDGTPGNFNQLGFSGFGFQGWFEAFASQPNLEIYLQPQAASPAAPSPQNEAVTVPNVIGETQSAAKGALSAAGLDAQVQQDASHPVPMLGTPVVESQAPTAGSRVPIGSEVVLTVGSG